MAHFTHVFIFSKFSLSRKAKLIHSKSHWVVSNEVHIWAHAYSVTLAPEANFAN